MTVLDPGPPWSRSRATAPSDPMAVDPSRAAGSPHAAPADRPRVLHVIEAVGGGTARHVVDLVTYARDVHHIVAAPETREGSHLSDPRMLSELEAAGAEVRVVPMRRSPGTLDNATAVRRIRKIIADEGVQVVHGHSSIGGVLGRLAAVGAPVGRVWTPHGLLRSRAVLAVERRLAPLTDVLVAVSQSEADLAIELKLTRPGRYVVIPNGIDPVVPMPSLDVRAELGLAPGTPLVGTVARLAEQKAPVDTVRVMHHALHRNPTAHAVLIGHGPLDTQVDAAIALGPSRDRIHRLRIDTGAGTVVSQFNVFLMTSTYEGGPYAPLEAMRAAVPVVLTACVGNVDVLRDGASGRCLPVHDIPALSDAVSDLLSDPVAATAMGLAGRDLMRATFDVRTAAARTVDMYQQLAAATAPSARGRRR